MALIGCFWLLQRDTFKNSTQKYLQIPLPRSLDQSPVNTPVTKSYDAAKNSCNRVDVITNDFYSTIHISAANKSL